MSEGQATKAQSLFDEFLREFDICNAEAGRQLDASAPTVLHWRRGDIRPSDFYRAKIKRWTRGWHKGPILMKWWRTANEAIAIQSVVPHSKPAHGGPSRPRVASPVTSSDERRVALWARRWHWTGRRGAAGACMSLTLRTRGPSRQCTTATKRAPWRTP